MRLDGPLILIAITHGNLGGLINLTRYPEQMRENVRKFDVKKATESWNKIRDLRHTLIQYLLHQNRFGTGENETTERPPCMRPPCMRQLELPEASLIFTNAKQELTVGGTLQTRTFLAPFGYEEIKVVHGEEENKSAGRLIIPKFPEAA